MVATIAQGANVQALLALMDQRERERLSQEKAVQELEEATVGIAMDIDAIVRELAGILLRWQDLMARNPDDARPMLAQLIDGRLTMTPRSNEEGRFYEFRGTGTFGPVIAGTAHKVASPAGVEPAS